MPESSKARVQWNKGVNWHGPAGDRPMGFTYYCKKYAAGWLNTFLERWSLKLDPADLKKIDRKLHE